MIPVTDLRAWRAAHPGAPKRPGGWRPPPSAPTPLERLGAGASCVASEPEAITVYATDSYEGDELARAGASDLREPDSAGCVAVAIAQGTVVGVLLFGPKGARELAARLRSGATEAVEMG